jgi:hypothetical protein
MNVSSVGNNLDLYALNALQPAAGPTGLTSLSGSSAAAGISGATAAGTDTAQITPAGQMLSKLQQLQAKDPAQFKQVLSDIAGKLQALAQQAGQGPGSQWLSSLADRFQTAAKTGDLSALQPHGHGHHHPHSSSGTYGPNGAQGQQTGPLTDPDGDGGRNGASSSTTGLKSQLSSVFSEIDTALAR